MIKVAATSRDRSEDCRWCRSNWGFRVVQDLSRILRGATGSESNFTNDRSSGEDSCQRRNWWSLRRILSLTTIIDVARGARTTTGRHDTRQYIASLKGRPRKSSLLFSCVMRNESMSLEAEMMVCQEFWLTRACSLTFASLQFGQPSA